MLHITNSKRGASMKTWLALGIVSLILLIPLASFAQAPQKVYAKITDIVDSVIPGQEQKQETIDTQTNERYTAADQHFSSGNYKEAVEFYEQYLANSNAFTDTASKEKRKQALFNLAQAYQNQGSEFYYQAEQNYLRFIKEFAQDTLTPQAQVNLAQIYLQKDQKQQALPQLEAAKNAQNNPQATAHAQFMLADLAYQEGDYTKAATNYAQALQNNDNTFLDLQSTQNAVITYAKQGDYKRSVEILIVLHKSNSSGTYSAFISQTLKTYPQLLTDNPQAVALYPELEEYII